MICSILIVDDEPLVREALAQTFELAGYKTILAGSFIVAKDHISAEFEGIILSDIRMPGRDGMYLLDYVKSVDPDLPVILLTGEGDIPMAVDAINQGAFDFLEKPCANDQLIEAARKAVRARELALENRKLRSEIARGDAASRMIFGISDVAEALRSQIRRVSQLDDAVRIDGAPGSGVSKVAEVTHLLSRRADQTFTRCAGTGLSLADLSDLLQKNQSGTVFVDEFAELPGATQHALLEHLDRRSGARILVGSTANKPEVDGFGGVIPELHYRLDAIRVRVPSLKERVEDIPVIFRHYVQQAAVQAQVPEPDVTSTVVADLLAQNWPGNTRALMNAATRFVLGLDLPIDGAPVGLVDKLAQVERTLIVDALEQHQGHASATAQHLQLPRKTFYDKLTKHRIKPEDYR